MEKAMAIRNVAQLAKTFGLAIMDLRHSTRFELGSYARPIGPNFAVFSACVRGWGSVANLSQQAFEVSAG
jgi:hypothetical protein